MLRITPLYGSRWDDSGVAKTGNCTLVEYANVRVLVNVGLYYGENDDDDDDDDDDDNNNRITTTMVDLDNDVDGTNNNNNNTTTTTTTGRKKKPYQPSSATFWEDLPPHDCLVLTDSTLESMGALPLYVKGTMRKYGRASSSSTSTSSSQPPPIYATFPTVKMGQMSLYDYHANISLDGGSPPFSLEDMDIAFARLQTIKYSQTLLFPLPTVKGNQNNDQQQQQQPQSIATAAVIVTPLLSITAHRAGHVVGGAFYVLRRLQDETTVVVTSTYSIAKELHLDSSTLLQYGATPDVLVTHPGGPASPMVSQLYHLKKLTSTPLVTQAQRTLTDHILSILRRDGNILLPVDASGRILELLLLLNRFWDHQRLTGSYNLVWLGSMVHNTLDFTRSQLEWMNTALGNQFDSHSGSGSRGPRGTGGGGGHPYGLREVHLCTNLTELEKITSNGDPTCVLASGMSLDHGPARDLLLRWADNDNNAIIFTDSSQCTYRRQATTTTASSSNRSRYRTMEQNVLIPNQDLVEGGDDIAVGNNNNTMMVGTGGNTYPGGRRRSSHNLRQVEDGVVGMMAGGPAVTPVTTAAGLAAAGPVVVAAPTVGPGGPNAADETTEQEEDTEVVGTYITEEEASEFTTSYQLLQHWCAAKMDDREMDDSVEVDVLIPRKVPLAGQELALFLQEEEATRRAQLKEEEERAMLREVELAKGRLRLGEDVGPTTSTPNVGSATNTSSSSAMTTNTTANLPLARAKKKSRFDSTLFLKFSKPLHLTFEVREYAVGVGQDDLTAKFGIGESMATSDVIEDDYGIAVLPGHFVDIVSGVDPSKFAGGSGRIGDEVTRRGMGYGNASEDKGTKKRRGGAGTDDDGGGGGDDDDDDDLDERELEAADLSEGRGIIRGRNGRPHTKVFTVNRRIQVLAEIDYIPLEGRVDSRAARQSVRALQPRQVVVLGGTQKDQSGKQTDDDEQHKVMQVDEVRILGDAARGFVTMNKAVLTPVDSETVELAVGHAAYSARLIATPYRTKEEQANEEVVPEPIELYETQIGACSVSLVDYVATGQKVALDGSIVLAPRRKSTSRLPAIYVSDGEVLLTDLRTELIALGMKAEYTAHVGYSQLIVNGRIVVKKMSDTGKLEVEGPLCEDFFAVRSIACNQYVTLYS